MQNTAYLVGGRLLIPGDSFFDPGKPVEVLATPVAGPWCKIGDAIRYAIKLKPRKAFPIHDGMLKKGSTGFIEKIIGTVLKESNIDFIAMGEGITAEF
ncbi:MAG: hypothetical protein KGJ13_00900 [Patescibacteria group bacterium]|nr:hypothetical protein [Patescibacteria group bacterium]